MTAAADTRRVPFPHATCTGALPRPCADEILCWMRSHAPWRLKLASFYEQWELPIDDASLPRGLEYLLKQGFVCALRDPPRSHSASACGRADHPYPQ